MASPHQRPPQVGDTTNLLLKKLVTATQDLGGAGGIFLTVAEANALYLKQLSNLSDLSNLVTARTNLGVSPTGGDTTYAFRANNLSDLANFATARTNLGTAFNQVIAKAADFNVLAAQNGAVFNVTTGASNVTATLPAGVSGMFFVLRKADAGAGIVLNSGTSTGLAVQGHSLLVYWDPTTAAWISRSWFGSESAAGALTISAGGSNQSIALNPSGTGAVTTTSTTLSVPDAFSLTSAGSIALTAGGSNKSVTITPSGTGSVIASYNAVSLTPAIGGVNVVGGNSSTVGFQVNTFAASPFFLGRRAGGTASVPAALGNGEVFFQLSAQGYDGSAYSGTRVGISAVTSQAWTGSNQGAQINFNVTPSNTAASIVGMRLENTGSLNLGAATNKTLPAWGVTGTQLQSGGITITDSTSSGTVATAVANSFAVPTFAASSATTFTNAANLYIAGDVAAGANTTLTNSYGLWNAGKTRLDGNALITGTSTLKFGATAAATIGVSADTTAGNLVLTGTTTGQIGLAAIGTYLPSTATSGLQIYNTADQTTNYERLELLFSSNQAIIRSTQGGSGSPRNLVLQNSGGAVVDIQTFGSTSNSTTGVIARNANAFSNTSGSNVMFNVAPTYNQASGSAANTDLLINRTQTAVGSGLQRLVDTQVGSSSKLSWLNTGIIDTYNGIATAGMGVAVVVAAPRQTAVTNATATLATYTVPAADSSYHISANVQVTAATAAAMTVVCTYTDETNTSRAQTMPFVQLAGTFLTSITNVTGTGPYEGATLHIRCKASTTIVFTTAGTVTGITYNIEGLVIKGS